MAVHPQSHNEAWKLVENDGTVLDKFNNGRDALQQARYWRRLGHSVQAVRA